MIDVKPLPALEELKKYIQSGPDAFDFDYFGRGFACPLKRYFSGTCHYASCALAKMMFGSARQFVVRGWYTETAALAAERDWIRNKWGHIGHSWVQAENRIIDPTWWAFHPEQPAAIYVFDAEDPRYHTWEPR